MTEVEWGHALLLATYVIGSLALLDLAAILILTIYTERKAPNGTSVLPPRQDRGRAGGPAHRRYRSTHRRYDRFNDGDG